MKHFIQLLGMIYLAIMVSAAYAGDGRSSGHHSQNHGGQHARNHGGHNNKHHGGNHSRHHGGHRRHRSHSSFVFSYGGYYGDPFFRYPYNYPSPVIVQQPPAPVIYVEKLDQNESNYWYYCTEPKGYYPHVKRCPVGWMQVVPHSPQP